MRYIGPHVIRDLARKMVFVGGPRQVGKTTLAREILKQAPGGGRIFLWDDDDDRRDVMEKRWSKGDGLLVFDELHKHPRWKSWVKGVYDLQREEHSILVTGSARLDVYRRGGDSLMGRYHYWRLHPFALDEIPAGMSAAEALKRLMIVGGFPEPFLDFDEREARRWRRERFDRVLREDVRDLESIRNIQILGLLLDSLRGRVGGPVVLAHLASDLEVSHRTVKAWIEVLERMYLIFAVRPYSRKLPRAVLKPPKIFFHDVGDVEGGEGERFENLVAAGLRKRLDFLEDRDGHRYELRYLRDKEGREVDFVVVRDGKIEELVEAKWADETPSRSLQYYAERLAPERATQVVAKLRRPYDLNRLSVVDPATYFRKMAAR